MPLPRPRLLPHKVFCPVRSFLRRFLVCFATNFPVPAAVRAVPAAFFGAVHILPGIFGRPHTRLVPACRFFFATVKKPPPLLDNRRLLCYNGGKSGR